MYADYFGLKELPFSIAPNPRFLYMSNAHQEALAHLLYGLDRTGGFIVLTGEVGTGKTTLSRRALENSPDDIRTAFIITPNLAPEQLLEAICDELGIEFNEGDSIRKLTDCIHHDLIKNHGEGMHTVLIIDEAQNMQRKTLEQIRMLTNLETNEEKLLRIILIGQPELTKLLRQDNMRQLRQRITGAYHLSQLDETNTRSYIESRLHTAGASRPIFEAGAFKRIYKLSKGIPRIINVLCDRAMLGAYSHGENLVTAKHVQRAHDELDTLEYSSNTKKNTRSIIALLIGLILFALIGFFAYRHFSNTNQLTVQAGAGQFHTLDNVHNAQVRTLSESFKFLTKNNLGNEVSNCARLSPLGYKCEAYNKASISDLKSFEIPVLVETENNAGFAYWLLRNIEDSSVTLDNGYNQFTVTPNLFSSIWTGSFIAIVEQ